MTIKRSGEDFAAKYDPGSHPGVRGSARSLVPRLARLVLGPISGRRGKRDASPRAKRGCPPASGGLNTERKSSE